MIPLHYEMLQCVVQSLSRVQPCDPINCSMPGFPGPHCQPEFAKLMSIESVMPSNHLILCCPLFLLPSIFPSIRVFSSESALLIRWPNYWSSSFSISLSNEYSGLISFRIAWLNVLTVQGAPKSSPTPQFKSINSKCLAFFMVNSHTCTRLLEKW